MNEKKILFLILCCFFTALPAVELVHDGKPKGIIQIEESATEAEKYAAEELRQHIRMMSGAELPYAEAGRPGNILIGQSAEIRRLLPDVNFSELEEDEILIRTVGDRLILTGGRPRGTLYAVDTYLEEQFGIRWWTSKASLIPRKKDLESGKWNLRYASHFKIREIFFWDIRMNPEFASRMKNNGHETATAMKFGGNCVTIGFIHTFDKLIPAKKYLKSHPEYFALSGSERRGGAHIAQLCLSNPSLAQEMTKNALALLRQYQNPRIISISQNDNAEFCKCPKCSKIASRKGQSGLMLEFVNKVAKHLHQKYPNLRVQTLAYDYTRHAPKGIRPDPGVIVQFTLIQNDFSRPLDAQTNQRHYQDIRDWQKAGGELAIWDYAANFDHYLIPHPNISSLGRTLRILRDCNVTDYFCLGAYNTGNEFGYFSELKVWLLSKLAWNPDQDENKLIKEFMTGYYGKAAKHLWTYLNLMEKEKAKSTATLTAFESDTFRWLSADSVIRADSILRDALEQVKDDPLLAKRVRMQKVANDLVLLERYSTWKAEGKLPPGIDFQKRKAELLALLAESGLQKFSEKLQLAQLENHLDSVMAGKTGIVPVEFKHIPRHRIAVAHAEDFSLAAKGNQTFIEKDPAASNGKAVRMTGNHFNWAVQYVIPARLLPKVHLYVYARVELKQKNSGNAVYFGLYDREAKKEKGFAIPVEKFRKHAGYLKIDMGTFQKVGKAYFYASPCNNSSVKNIFFDRLVIIKED